MKIKAVVSSVYLGQKGMLEKLPKDSIEVNLEGVVGDTHYGFTKPADSRNKEYVRGTEMRNDRQWSAVSLEELSIIAKEMGVPEINAGWIGSNFAVSGVDDFTKLPKGTKLIFPKDVVLVVEDENKPCIEPGKVISSKYPDLNIKPGLFPKAAIGKRGLIGVIERPGVITIGDEVTINVYKPKSYSLPVDVWSFE